MELRYLNFIENCLAESNPDLPILFTAHATIQGADYGGERFVMLGKDQVLSGSLVRNPNFDYVALGHIHKPQNLNENAHPPVIYPGSIERVDFGEINDDKFFVVAHVEKGKTQIEWVPLNGRRFLDHTIDLRNIKKHGFSDETTPTPQQIRAYFEEYLPETDEIADTIARLQLKYPRDWEVLIEDHWIRERYQSALEFQLIRKPIVEARLRLPDDQEISSIPPEQLLKIYLENQSQDPEEIEVLQALAKEIIQHHDKMEVTE
jgi:exonuclease SbcD